MDALDDDIGQSKLLREKALLKASLHHAAAVLVGANLVTVSHARIEDELSVHSKVLRTRPVSVLRLV